MANQYYVYYDIRTRDILSITNEQNTSYENGIIVSFEDVENFLEGKWHFKDFKVDYETGSTELKIISNSAQGFDFNTNEFKLIESGNNDADLIIEWNLPKKSWIFSLSQQYKRSFNGVFNSNLMFFITLESDHDFLIRTIYIDADELKRRDFIDISFNTDIENKIEKISISSRMNFKNYNLKVIHEN